MDKKTIEVDTTTFIRFWLVILAFALIALFIWKALPGLIIIGIALFLAIAIQPLAKKIRRLQKNKNSHLASVLAYVIIIVALGLIFAVVAPVIIDETVKFVSQLPDTINNTLGGWEGINRFGQSIGIDNLQSEISSALQSFSNEFVSNFSNILFSGIGTVASVITGVILTLILTLLMSLQGPAILKRFWSLLEGRRKNTTVRAYQRLAERLAGVISSYVSKQVFIAVLDGCVTGVAVLLLALIFGFAPSLALPLGLIAFVFYLIPMFGPIIGCALNAILLFFSSPIASVIYLVFYIIYAQIENNVIAPKVQGDAQGLPTVVILIAIIIGMYMFGLIGAIVAIPIAGGIKVVLEELPNLRAHSD